jgi:surface polysaccharide O-acyltransferase-like enzyme
MQLVITNANRTMQSSDLVVATIFDCWMYNDYQQINYWRICKYLLYCICSRYIYTHIDCNRTMNPWKEAVCIRPQNDVCLSSLIEEQNRCMT